MNEATLIFTVGFKHLSPDAKRADLEYGDFERQGVSAKELRELLRAAEATAPTVAYPLAPELRVTAPSGRYVLQLRDRRLNFVSWSSAKSRGGNPTVDQIFSIITGEEMEDQTTPMATVAPEARGGLTGKARWVVGALLVLTIAGVNAYTVWNYKKPPGNLLPPYHLVESEPAKRLLESMAGNYETGSGAGDRRLQISRSGVAIWIKFGPGRSEAERHDFTVDGAESGGQPAFLTSRKSLIVVKDPTSLLLFGDTYLRVEK